MSAKPAFQITDQQFAAGLQRLEEKWAKDQVPHTPAIAKQLYRYTVFELVHAVLSDPVSGGWMYDLAPAEVVRLTSTPPVRFTARASGSAILTVRPEQLDAAAKKVYRAWQSDAGAQEFYPNRRLSFELVKRMVINTLCRVLGEALADPDGESGLSVCELLDWKPRPKRQWIAKYGTRRTSMATSA